MVTRIKKLFWLDAVVLLAYCVIGSLLVLRHEPWSDEAAPWLIARDTDLKTFFHHLINNYDRHPCLWYILLRPFAHYGFPYLAQFILHFIIAITAVVLFLVNAPFSRLIKYLWIFSYFMLYEYAIVARPYVLAVTLIFAIASLYPKRYDRPWLYALLTALLFNSSYLVFAFGIGLVGLYLWDLQRCAKPWKRFVLPLTIMAAGALLAFRQGGMLPVDHVNYGIHPAPNYAKALESVTKAFVPFAVDISPQTSLIVAVMILIASVLALWTRPAVLALLLAAWAELLYIFVFVHWGDLRHYGFFLVFLFFALWIRPYHATNRWADALESRSKIISSTSGYLLTAGLIGFCLLVSLRPTWHVIKTEYKLPFSSSKVMAENINNIFSRYKFDEQGFAIVAYSHSSTVSLLPYMPQRKFWYPYLKNFATYYTNNTKLLTEEKFSHDDVVRETLASFGDLSKIFLLVSQTPLALKQDYGYDFQLVAAASEKVFGYTYERFFLYKPIPLSAKSPPHSSNESTS